MSAADVALPASQLQQRHVGTGRQQAAQPQPAPPVQQQQKADPFEEEDPKAALNAVDESPEECMFSCNICYDVRPCGSRTGHRLGEPGAGLCFPLPDLTLFTADLSLQLASEPVVTLCGHLYCWPCLYRWLQVQSHCRTCPVCKAGVEKDKVSHRNVKGRGQRDAGLPSLLPPRCFPLPPAAHPCRPGPAGDPNLRARRQRRPAVQDQGGAGDGAAAPLGPAPRPRRAQPAPPACRQRQHAAGRPGHHSHPVWPARPQP
jgi:E3 ubiquitin-protein ligase RNF5